MLKKIEKQWRNRVINGIETVYIEYSDGYLIKSWGMEHEQGNIKARGKGHFCVSVACNKQEAVKLSRAFVRHCFAIPTCCHFSNNELSAYCGDAGRGAIELMAKTKTLFQQMTIDFDEDIYPNCITRNIKYHG